MTIKEIAALANVSVATVSYVLNNTGRVSSEIRERVWNIAREHGFTPNTNARNLVKKRNLRVGIMISDTAYLKSSTFFNNIAAGVIDKISTKNMDLVILLKENSFESWTQNAVGVDGVIVIDPVSDDIFIDWMRKSKIPFVVIGRYSDNENEVPSVDADNCNISYAATKILLEKGHRHILINLGPQHYTGTEDQIIGINRALNEFGIKDGVHYCYTPFEIDENSAKLNAMFRVHPEITAIITASDSQSINVNIQLAKLGLKTPDDKSLLCLAGTHVTKNHYPRISSFYTSFEKMGEYVADILLELFNQENSTYRNVKVAYTFDEGETIRSIK